MAKQAQEKVEGKNKRRGNNGDEDEQPLRQVVREYVDGSVVTIIMTVTTIFALIGDDFRVWFTDKEADPYFFFFVLLSFALFTLELLLKSCVVDDFKFSFFFWLDFIATMSLLMDLPFFMDSAQGLFNLPSSLNKINVAFKSQEQTGNENVMKLLRSFRLIRLIRIIKLYNYAVKSNAAAEEAKLREQQKLSANAQQAILKKELEPSRLGIFLTDTITKKLVIVILVLLMFLPLLSYSGEDYSTISAMRELFRFGSSSCVVDRYSGKDILANVGLSVATTAGDTHFCEKARDAWITQEGWEQHLRNFIVSTRKSETSDVDKELVWLFLPDYNRQGRFAEIKWVPDSTHNVTTRKIEPSKGDVKVDVPPPGAKVFWQQCHACSGFIVNTTACPLRVSEMKLEAYQPAECKSGKISGCEKLVAYARFNIKKSKQRDAASQFLITLVTCVIMCIGSVLISHNTDTIIIEPVAKMVGIIKTLADDPLKKPDEPVFTEEELNSNPKATLKTVELQKTIFRIGKLLQQSFGQLGALIIRENVSSGDGSLGIMIPGGRHNVIFMVIRLQNYVFVTDILQEESIQFLNQIMHILHACAATWDGSANKSEGERYVLTWMLPAVDDSDNEKNEELLERRTELADKSLITAVKIVSEMRRAQDIQQYYKKPEIMAKYGASARPTLTFALHMGWTIQGAIGSESKIDASYMSPHLQASYKIEKMCAHYDQQIIVSESLYNMMSLKARNTLRKIDVISMREHKEPIGIYTYDLAFSAAQEAMMMCGVADDHEIGALIKLAEYENINIESFQNKGVDYMFTLDSDLVGLQQHIGEFAPLFRQAFKCYVTGEWEQAFDHIERCLELWDTDGPTKALKTYMQFHRFQPPGSWTGYWDIDEEIDVEKINMDNYDVDDENEGTDQEPGKDKDKKSKSGKSKDSKAGKKNKS